MPADAHRSPSPWRALPDFASRSEVAALRRERKLHVGQLALRRLDNPDGRLGTVLAMVFAFSHNNTFSRDKPWTAAELVEDARCGAPDLWVALDQITGSRGDPAVRLGGWLERQGGAEADGYRLERVRRKCGVWTYRVAELD